MIYGYARISTQKQSIQRQITNISREYPSIKIYEDTFTGTTVERPNFEKLLSVVREGDTIVFDSVSRMSRNAAAGVELYKKLFADGISLVFIKEPHINTDVFKAAMQDSIAMTGTDVDVILAGVNAYLIKLAEKQIEIAFDQAEKEVTDLRERTKEGIREAKAAGTVVGRAAGSTVETTKAAKAKQIILKCGKVFGGTMNDSQLMKLCGVSRNSIKKYTEELKQTVEQAAV